MIKSYATHIVGHSSVFPNETPIDVWGGENCLFKPVTYTVKQ